MRAWLYGVDSGMAACNVCVTAMKSAKASSISNISAKISMAIS